MPIGFSPPFDLPLPPCPNLPSPLPFPFPWPFPSLGLFRGGGGGPESQQALSAGSASSSAPSSGAQGVGGTGGREVCRPVLLSLRGKRPALCTSTTRTPTSSRTGPSCTGRSTSPAAGAAPPAPPPPLRPLSCQGRSQSSGPGGGCFVRCRKVLGHRRS